MNENVTNTAIYTDFLWLSISARVWPIINKEESFMIGQLRLQRIVRCDHSDAVTLVCVAVSVVFYRYLHYDECGVVTHNCDVKLALRVTAAQLPKKRRHGLVCNQ